MFDRRYTKAFLKSIYKPMRLLNFLKYKIWSHKKAQKLNYLPYVLDIEPTTTCNFRCRMCQVNSLGYKRNHMDIRLFKKILDENPQLFKIKLQGMGEPLLCPDLFEMIKYASKKKVLVEIITNGSLFDKKNIQNIIDLHITKLTVSLDGATKETFEKIRQGADFDKVKSGTFNLATEIKKKNKNIHLNAWTVLQKDNIHESKEIVKLCKEIGFNHLTFQAHLTAWGKTVWMDRNKEFKISLTEENMKLLNNSIETGKRINLPTRIYYGDIYNFNRQCCWPWHSLFINCRGQIIPCCIIADSEVKSFGSIHEYNLQEIWNNMDYQEFRKRLKENDIPSFCRNCYGI